MDAFILQTALALLAASCLGALPPLTRRWSERGLHLFVALAAGVFLGTIFLHLLPHMAGVNDADHGAGGDPDSAALTPWIAALAGLALLFALEKVWLPTWTRGGAPNQHSLLWAATFVGLSIHALTEGFALSAIAEHPEARTQIVGSILIHKATEAFSLATVMRLANLPARRAGFFLALFALVEPLGLVLGHLVVKGHPSADSLVTGFACGTFLYVALCDLLPEVFHGADRPRTKLALVLVGVAVTAITVPRLEWLGGFGIELARASWSTFVEMAPYLLLGFAVAGFVQQVLPRALLARRLAGDNLRSVAWAALIGAPLPLCSCSVVPVAVGLRKAGASKGATSAFTIATPETGLDSMAVTWALLDPFLTFARPIGALISAFSTGSAVNWLVRRGLDRDPTPAAVAPVEAAPSCCHHDEPAAAGAEHADGDGHGHAGLDHHVHADSAARTWIGRARSALTFAYVEMLDDLAGSLLFGIVLSALIAVALPADVFASPIASGFGGLVLMLLLGIPIYVCAAASTPIAAALILKGLSPGAAFVFLLAGPATNTASLFVLARQLGRRVVLVQVVVLGLVTLALGFIVDVLYHVFRITPHAALAASEHHMGGDWFSLACAVVLAGLIIASLVRTHGARDLFGGLRGTPVPAP